MENLLGKGRFAAALPDFGYKVLDLATHHLKALSNKTPKRRALGLQLIKGRLLLLGLTVKTGLLSGQLSLQGLKSS
jgi:hypothetical protein